MNSGEQIKSSSLYKKIYRKKNLIDAWKKVKSNGQKSTLKLTQDAIKSFESEIDANLTKIQTALRQHNYSFSPAKGVLQKKKNKKPRPIVMACIEDRIVQRAILQVIQKQNKIERQVNTPYSFGGIEDKNIEIAIAKVQSKIQSKSVFFIKSDIKSFFTRINKTIVMEFFAQSIPEIDVRELLTKVIETQLCKEDEIRLGKDLAFFPLAETGIAQGSCLSPLIANIYLFKFDEMMNQKGISCFRYIDDLIFLGPQKDHLKKAFNSGKAYLHSLALEVYDPFFSEEGKADYGKADKGFDLLGCSIIPGLTRPSNTNKQKFLDRLEQIMEDSKKEIQALPDHEMSPRLGFISTLSYLNNSILGWGHAFSFCNDYDFMKHIDIKIEKIIEDYFLFIKKKRKQCPSRIGEIFGLYNLQKIANEKKERDKKIKDKIRKKKDLKSAQNRTSSLSLNSEQISLDKEVSLLDLLNN